MVLLETKKHPGGCTKGRTYLFTAETGYQGGLKLFWRQTPATPCLHLPAQERAYVAPDQ